jgi:hemerythrin
MPFMVWNDQLSVGIESIDADHKKLVAIVNEFYDAICAGQSEVILSSLLDRLIDYTRQHFVHEEELFARTGYLDADEHKREHEAMAERLADLRHRILAGKVAAPSLEVMCELKDWLFEHVLASDQKYVPHLKAMDIR